MKKSVIEFLLLLLLFIRCNVHSHSSKWFIQFTFRSHWWIIHFKRNANIQNSCIRTLWGAHKIIFHVPDFSHRCGRERKRERQKNHLKPKIVSKINFLSEWIKQQQERRQRNDNDNNKDIIKKFLMKNIWAWKSNTYEMNS